MVPDFSSALIAFLVIGFVAGLVFGLLVWFLMKLMGWSS